MTTEKIVPVKERVNTVRDLLLKNRAQIEMALPKHLSADRMLRLMMTCISRTPQLLDCTPRSLVGALIQCAQLGLEPGIQGRAWILPFKNRQERTVEAQFIPGYLGLADLAYRSGKVLSIDAEDVRKGDKFRYQRGLTPILEHTPSEAVNRHEAELSHFYAIIRFVGGGSHFRVMTNAEVEAHRDRYSRAAKDGPWVTNYSDMGKKTVLRQTLKLSPMSVEVQRAIALDEHAEVQIPQNLGDVVDFGEEEKKSPLDQLADTAKGETEPAA